MREQVKSDIEIYDSYLVRCVHGQRKRTIEYTNRFIKEKNRNLKMYQKIVIRKEIES